VLRHESTRGLWGHRSRTFAIGRGVQPLADCAARAPAACLFYGNMGCGAQRQHKNKRSAAYSRTAIKAKAQFAHGGVLKGKPSRYFGIGGRKGKLKT